MGNRFRNRFTTLAILALLAILTGCSTVLYQANGEYIEGESSRRILLQWEAQRYHIPFIDTAVDYGSVSLQVECMEDLLLDHKSDPNLGLVFLELPQDYRLVVDAPELRAGNHLICAKLNDNQSIEDLIGAETVKLLILCESRFNSLFIPASLEGYSLNVSSGGLEETLGCDI